MGFFSFVRRFKLLDELIVRSDPYGKAIDAAIAPFTFRGVAGAAGGMAMSFLSGYTGSWLWTALATGMMTWAALAILIPARKQAAASSETSDPVGEEIHAIKHDMIHPLRVEQLSLKGDLFNISEIQLKLVLLYIMDDLIESASSIRHRLSKNPDAGEMKDSLVENETLCTDVAHDLRATVYGAAYIRALELAAKSADIEVKKVNIPDDVNHFEFREWFISTRKASATLNFLTMQRNALLVGLRTDKSVLMNRIGRLVV